MRGGTSKGLYFDLKDIPKNIQERDQMLLAVMGSPDIRQIDGVGGGHPLTSKVAIISKSQDEDVDIDYLFLQVSVDKNEVSDAQNCGNILAGIGPWAIENGYVDACLTKTKVRIKLVNTGAITIAEVETPKGVVNYQGDCCIDGVPGSSAPIVLAFLDIAGSSCGALIPTGNTIDIINNTEVTCIDNGMPVVLLRAKDFGLQGNESLESLESNIELKQRLESIRLKAGELMNLGDVSKKTVPKMTLISSPINAGLIHTRSFIPHRVHEAIGVLGAVSVATGCILAGSVASSIISFNLDEGSSEHYLSVEHPTGSFTVNMHVKKANHTVEINRSALLRTARKLMVGEVFYEVK